MFRKHILCRIGPKIHYVDFVYIHLPRLRNAGHILYTALPIDGYFDNLSKREATGVDHLPTRASCNLSYMTCRFQGSGVDGQIPLHADTGGMPAPLPP